MTEQFKIEDFQKVSNEGFDAVARAYSEVNKGVQAIATETTDYCRKAFEHATGTFEKLVSVKSFEQAIEIQSQYAKKAYNDYIAQVTKLTDMYVNLARRAFSPVEKAVAKKVA